MKALLIVFTVLFSSFSSFCQKNADAILGKWMKTPKEDLIILVYKVGDEYKGRIAWSKDNESKKTGFIILEDLKYNPGKNMWKSGIIHDPGSDKTYDAEAKIKSDGTLEVLGYLGMRFLGKKKYFRKVK